MTAPSDTTTAEVLRFTVRGKPVTQGSLRSLGTGRPSVHSNAKTLKPWRQDLAAAAQDAMRGWARLEGPVNVDVVFAFDLPASAPKRRRIWPITRSSGDVDKLARALLAAGVVKDDSQVVRLVAEKVWTGEHPGLPVPGAHVIITAVAS
jgi:Holliday junction resolvase RusA-like endonuclease